MLKTRIEFQNGRPFVQVNGEKRTPLAYTTYFDECGAWKDFTAAGYRMFFVNVSFTTLPINNTTGFSPFRTGVFENETPDYGEFDAMVQAILAVCPDALIFPRVHLAMPEKWLASHPEETVLTPCGARESLYSEAYKKDGAQLLKTLADHIRSSSYADRIAGYQLCGGTTQEWIHHDLTGSYSDMGMRMFSAWVKEKYGIDNIRIPSRAELTGSVLSDEVQKYYLFCAEKTAGTVEHFAKALKEHISNEQIVGVFYGYNCFVNDPLWGLHGLRKIIDSPYIDFFSSPCCYDNARKFGADWGDMLPADSVKLHGKLYFVECDIRTFRTRRMQDSRPSMYPDDIYPLHDQNGSRTVWCGPETLALSLSAVRKAFAHQITKSSGLWWFDMWGGWFADAKIMQELAQMRTVYEALPQDAGSAYPSAQVALFVDERAYANVAHTCDHRHVLNRTRVAFGNTGIPFDVYMVEDADRVLHRYKAAVFTAPVPSENGKKALSQCRELQIPCLSASEEKSWFTTEELRSFLVRAGVHCYNADGCVVYCANGILAVHTVADGQIRISLPEKFAVRSLFGDSEQPAKPTDTVLISATKHATAVFCLQKE